VSEPAQSVAPAGSFWVERGKRARIMADPIFAMTTVRDEPTAVRLAHALLERRLVACVNVVARVRSFYHWKGVIEEADEQLLLMKTREDCFDALRTAFDELHPYDVPELIALPIQNGSAAYLGWVDENVRRGEDEGS